MPKLVTDKNQASSSTNIEIYAAIMDLINQKIAGEQKSTEETSDIAHDVTSWFQDQKEK